jgi:hypothetical protein
MSSIKATRVEIELDYEEASDVAWALKHHLEYIIDTHWRNFPAEFWKREGKVIRITKEMLAMSGSYHVAEGLEADLKKRLEEKGVKPTT